MKYQFPIRKRASNWLRQQQAILQISQLQPSTSLQALIELPQLMAKEEAGTLTDEERARLIELIRQENGT